MGEEAWPEVLDLLAGIGEQWKLGESAWRVWGCILFKSCPVSQKEIEQRTGYSSGVVTMSLKKLKTANIIKEIIIGGETHYFVNTSLTDACGKFSKEFFEDNIRPLVTLLSENLNKIEDARVKKRFHELIAECKKLHLVVLFQSRMIEEINTGAIVVDMESVEENLRKNR